MLVPCCLLFGIVVTSAAEATATTTAADAVTLSDGSVVLGQVQGASPQGGLTVLVRRDWARSAIPSRLASWEREETLIVRRARRERKDRLIAWRQERSNDGGTDPLARAIVREVSRYSTLRPPRTLLTALPLARQDVRTVTRRDAATGRLLRLGWLAGLGDVEELSPADLRKALAASGQLRDAADPARVDALLPLYTEPAGTWEWRRAATEVTIESDLRFVRYRELLLPESAPTAEPQNVTDLIDSPTGRLAFGAIQAITPFDAERELLDNIAARGRSGAVLSRVSFNVDSDQAEAVAVLWVRDDNDHWTAALSKSATARTDEPAGKTPPPPDEEGGAIRTAALVLETVASTPSSPEVSNRRQDVGSVGQRALARARAALARDLEPLLLPVVPTGRR